MAGIQLGGAGAKKSVDSDIPLVPFIDLLLCCIMFLLATAVWNELKQVKTSQNTPGASCPNCPPPPESTAIELLVQRDGFQIRSNGGEEGQAIALASGIHDFAALHDKLSFLHRQLPEAPMLLSVDDGVTLETTIKTMDEGRRAGIAQIQMR